MAWEDLKDFIDLHITNKTSLSKINNVVDHSTTLNEVVDTFGQDYIYSGIATKTLTPINDDNNRYYIANGSVGTYIYFLDDVASPLTVEEGEFAIFKGVNNVWIKNSITTQQALLLLNDTPSTYAGSGGYGVFVNSAETGIEFLPVSTDNLVPYTGATEDLDMGVYDIRATVVAATDITTDSITLSTGETVDEISDEVGDSGGDTSLVTESGIRVGIRKFPYVEATSGGDIDETNGTINCTANSFSLRLENAADVEGYIFRIKNSGTGEITITTRNSETIDDLLTLDLSQYESVTLQSTGSNYIIL